jgi:hypothetical protein
MGDGEMIQGWVDLVSRIITEDFFIDITLLIQVDSVNRSKKMILIDSIYTISV